MNSKVFFVGANVSCTEPPVNTSRGLMQLEMQRKINGNEANELADRYLNLRGGQTAN